jgi:hypothetical protein
MFHSPLIFTCHQRANDGQVNRLTRELSLLRAAQNASVVSNASSTSNSAHQEHDTSSNHLLSGAAHSGPTPRHHRTSSSTSVRSTAGTAGSILSSITPSSERAPRTSMSRHNSNTGTAISQNQAAQSQSQSLSRQNSLTSSRRSGASSPALLSNSFSGPDHFPSFYSQRPTPSSHPSSQHISTHPVHLSGQERERDRLDSGVSIGGSRYEEVAYHRSELEAVKRENEALRRRIRELESMVRRRGSGSAGAGVARSLHIEGDRESGHEHSEKVDDEVRVGESARGGGFP